MDAIVKRLRKVIEVCTPDELSGDRVSSSDADGWRSLMKIAKLPEILGGTVRAARWLDSGRLSEADVMRARALLPEGVPEDDEPKRHRWVSLEKSWSTDDYDYHVLRDGSMMMRSERSGARLYSPGCDTRSMGANRYFTEPADGAVIVGRKAFHAFHRGVVVARQQDDAVEWSCDAPDSRSGTITVTLEAGEWRPMRVDHQLLAEALAIVSKGIQHASIALCSHDGKGWLRLRGNGAVVAVALLKDV